MPPSEKHSAIHWTKYTKLHIIQNDLGGMLRGSFFYSRPPWRYASCDFSGRPGQQIKRWPIQLLRATSSNNRQQWPLLLIFRLWLRELFGKRHPVTSLICMRLGSEFDKTSREAKTQNNSFKKPERKNKDQINPSNQTRDLKAWKVPSLWVMSATPHNSSSRRLVGREWTSPVFKSTSTAPGTPTAFLSSFLGSFAPASGRWGAAATQDAPSGPCPGPTPSPRRGLVDSSLATFVANVSQHRLLAKKPGAVNDERSPTWGRFGLVTTSDVCWLPATQWRGSPSIHL